MKKCECPRCGKEGSRAIYYGLPVKLCTDEECTTLWGFWSRALLLLPFNGTMMVYEDGGYLRALWHWLTRFEVQS